MSAREDAMAALVALIDGAYAWNAPTSRRLKLWGDVPVYSRPCAFVFGGGGQNYVWGSQQRANVKREKTVDLVIYIDAHDTSTSGDIQIDDILDALDVTFASNTDFETGRRTLGGLVHDCRIDGVIRVDPGDIDGDGMIWGKIRIVFP
jgi:hypothetical protein